MKFGDAMRTCLLRGLSFRGRSSRAEFFKFLPFGIGICVIVGAFAVWRDFTLPGVLLSVFCAAVPILAVWWRRLQDVGIAGIHAILPWVAFFYALVFGWAATQAGPLLNVDYPQWRNPMVLILMFPLGVIGYLGNVFGTFVGQMIAIFVALPLIILFLVRLSFATGQVLLPSLPGPNKYGPNPNEVPQ